MKLRGFVVKVSLIAVAAQIGLSTFAAFAIAADMPPQQQRVSLCPDPDNKIIGLNVTTVTPAAIADSCLWQDRTVLHISAPTTNLQIIGGTAVGLVTLRLERVSESDPFSLTIRNFTSQTNVLAFVGRLPHGSALSISHSSFTGDGNAIPRLDRFLNFVFLFANASRVEIFENRFFSINAAGVINIPKCNATDVSIHDNVFDIVQRSVGDTKAIDLSAYVYTPNLPYFPFHNSELDVSRNTFVASGESRGTTFGIDVDIRYPSVSGASTDPSLFSSDLVGGFSDSRSVASSSSSSKTDQIELLATVAASESGKSRIKFIDNSLTNVGEPWFVSAVGIDLQVSGNSAISDIVSISTTAQLGIRSYPTNCEITNNRLKVTKQGLQVGIAVGVDVVPENSLFSISGNSFTTGTVDSLYFPIILISETIVPAGSEFFISANVLHAYNGQIGRHPRVFMIGYIAQIPDEMNLTNAVTVCKNTIFGKEFCGSLEQARSIIYSLRAPLIINTAKCPQNDCSKKPCGMPCLAFPSSSAPRKYNLREFLLLDQSTILFASISAIMIYLLFF